ncbi:leucine-rich repeat domain-containing protein [Prevotella melaninogenica]
MQISTIRKSITTLVLLLVFSVSHAQKVIKVEKPGELSKKITSSEKFSITDLTISGSINGADILCLREMAGRDVEGKPTEGKLSTLDLSGAKIVANGGNYYQVKSGMYTKYYAPAYDDEVSAYMFYQCQALITLKLPTTTKSIEQYAFSGCTSLTECVIPQSVATMRENAFKDCGKLASIVLPNSLKEISKCAFAGCKSLASVTFPSQLEKIGAEAFENCTSLATLSEFPASLSEIEEKAFYNTAVTAYSVSEDNDDYSSQDGVLYDGNKIAIQLYPAGSGATSFEFPESVAEIDDYAFAYAKNLKNISLPEGLTNVGKNAFEHAGLEQFTSLASNLSIGESAFSDCAELKTVDFKGIIGGMGNYAFKNNKNLSVVQFAGSAMPEFGQYVFTPRAVKLKVYVEKNLIDKFKDAFTSKKVALGTMYEILDITTSSIAKQSVYESNIDKVHFDVCGRKISKHDKGLHIIQYSDGRVVKRMVR